MRQFLIKLLFLIVTLFNLNLWALGAPSIIGQWQYTSYDYKGHNFPVDFDRVNLKFTFSKDGISNLIWMKNTENVFCERNAEYALSTTNGLFQKNIWVNPKNHISCSEDPDMRLGALSATQFHIEGDMLVLHLTLAGDPFYYNLTRITKKSKFPKRPLPPN